MARQMYFSLQFCSTLLQHVSTMEGNWTYR